MPSTLGKSQFMIEAMLLRQRIVVGQSVNNESLSGMDFSPSRLN
jgi:hypothetical protein